MGNAEIIFVLAGIAWAVASAIAQKAKKKKQQASRKAAILKESAQPVVEDPLPVAESPAPLVEVPSTEAKASSSYRSRLKKLRDDRLQRLRQRAVARQGGAAPAGPGPLGGIKVPPGPPRPKTAREKPEERSRQYEAPHDPSFKHSKSNQGPGHKMAAMELRKALSSRERLQEAFVIKELLDPPLALRAPQT